MNILCATDDNYAPYCGIMLTSLLENNRDSGIDIFIMASELSTQNRQRMSELAERFGCNIQIISPDLTLLAQCPIKEGDHVSLAAYYRILCGSLLPENVQRVLYLDCDIVVNTNLKSLYNIDLGENIIGACIDSYNTIHSQRLELHHDYICSGVMLFDMVKYRECGIEKRCLNEINKDAEKFIYHDQDVLNVVLEGRIKYLSPKYNMMSAFLRRKKDGLQMREELVHQINETLESEGNKLIIHYEYLPKPWQKWVMMPHPFTELWYYYRKLSPWSDAPINRKAPLKFKLNVIMLRLLWRLGIKKKPDYYLL